MTIIETVVSTVTVKSTSIGTVTIIDTLTFIDTVPARNVSESSLMKI